jgi:hypothetical protein
MKKLFVLVLVIMAAVILCQSSFAEVKRPAGYGITARTATAPAYSKEDMAKRKEFSEQNKVLVDKMIAINKRSDEARKNNDKEGIEKTGKERALLMEEMRTLREKYSSLFPARPRMTGEAMGGSNDPRRKMFEEQRPYFEKMRETDRKISDARKASDEAGMKKAMEERKGIMDKIKEIRDKYSKLIESGRKK